jgi:rhomboid protease GluP
MEPVAERGRHLPWVTIFLALASVGVFVWELSAGADPMMPTPQWMMEHGGNFGPLTLGGEQWRLVTSMFLHYGVVHIAMNMIGLIDGGRHVERMYGRAGFVALYLVSGLAASLTSALRGGAISAGASGAVFGVFGAFGAFLLLHRDRLDRTEVSRQARGLLVFLAYNIFFGLTTPGIDMAAHIGGVIAGFLVGLALEAGTSHDQSTRRRSLIVAVLGVALVAGGAYVAPKPHSPLSELTELDEMQDAVLHRWREVAAQADAGKINEEQFADVIESEILPKWRKVHEGYQKSVPAELRVQFREYTAARKDGWEGMARALRTGDSDSFQKALVRFKEGDVAIERMKKEQD